MWVSPIHSRMRIKAARRKTEDSTWSSQCNLGAGRTLRFALKDTSELYLATREFSEAVSGLWKSFRAQKRNAEPGKRQGGVREALHHVPVLRGGAAIIAGNFCPAAAFIR